MGSGALCAMFLGATVLMATPAPQQQQPETPAPAAMQTPIAGQPTFRAGVDLVTIRAIVRDGKGRPVTTLTAKDFELIDDGKSVPIQAAEQDSGPVGLALLFDISGSMDIDERFSRARETSYFLLSGLRNGEDEAAIFAFDSGLHVVQPFTTELDRLRGSLSSFSPWGMTSIHDAIASASRSMDARATKRRALVVLTDGFDTASKLGAAEVSRIASSIDLPVYLVAVVPSIDDPRDERGREPGACRGSRGSGAMDGRRTVRRHLDAGGEHHRAAGRQRTASTVL